MVKTKLGPRLGSTAAWLLWMALGPVAAAGELPWFEGGRPGAQAREAVSLLATAATQGLEPRDYGALELQQAIDRAAQGVPPAPAAVAGLERALDAAMQRYLADLHHGRIDPARIHHAFTPPRREAFDAAAQLAVARASGRLVDAAHANAPRLPQYGQLLDALARYRALVDHPAWRQPLSPLPAAPRGKLAALEPGQPWPGLPLLAQRLQALGDADAAAGGADATLYEGSWIDAVKSFQLRHGLAADGVVGRTTLARLQVPPAARVRQIELALERLRWTPLMQGPRMVVINIPEFVLRAYEVQDGRIAVQQAMKVIVGAALDKRTPLFDEELRFIEFSPYWNVPPSIARAELVPRLRRDPAYLAREGFEFVAADGSVSRTLSPDRLDDVVAGRLRIRQRPGARNALGDIKFVFPNRNQVYLHHTPSVALFDRQRRDFSHGCIRVELPVALAEFVLQGQSGWTVEHIRQAMTQGRTSTVAVNRPVRVLIAYGTALVKQGRIHFYDDIYGLDPLLDAALRGRAAPAPASGQQP
jgi:murein L,D-transpeptidase YcbB/YkuD